jgi:hypothetical protein
MVLIGFLLICIYSTLYIVYNTTVRTCSLIGTRHLMSDQRKDTYAHTHMDAHANSLGPGLSGNYTHCKYLTIETGNSSIFDVSVCSRGG